MSKQWIVWGISELDGWLLHRNPAFGSPSGRDAEDCLDGHLACGIDHVAWDLGRGVLNYHSDLPGATCKGLTPTPPDANYNQRMLEGIYRQRCQLRAALRHARVKGMTIHGRLCMNRHYAPGSSAHSRFAQLHPQWCEITADGWLDPSRMCYGIPQVREERITILMEAVNVGVDGLHLDFCRQPPMVGYHAAFVNGFREQHGIDPRSLTLQSDRDAYLQWCAYRADAITTMLRDLKAQLDPFRARWRRDIPVHVRVPNDGFEANLTVGLDVVTWCREGLIDELALSELRWLKDYQHWDDAPYAVHGRKHRIPVFGSSNCLPLQNVPWKDGKTWSCELNPHGVNPLVLARRALQRHHIGCDGIALYQSDTGIQREGIRDAITAMSSPDLLHAYVNDPANTKQYPVTTESADYGIDNHSLVF